MTWPGGRPPRWWACQVLSGASQMGDVPAPIRDAVSSHLQSRRGMISGWVDRICALPYRVQRVAELERCPEDCREEVRRLVIERMSR